MTGREAKSRQSQPMAVFRTAVLASLAALSTWGFSMLAVLPDLGPCVTLRTGA